MEEHKTFTFKRRIPVYTDDDFIIIDGVKTLTEEKQKHYNSFVEYQKSIKHETWRNIPDFPMHEISNFGNIRNKENGKQLKGGSAGLYKSTSILDKNGKRRSQQIHILVVRSFLPNPYDKPIVNHIDGNKHNNHLTNLEWSTHSENVIHAVETGLLDNSNSNGSPLGIYKTDMRGKILEKYSCVKEASEKTGISNRRIRNVFTGATTDTDGYKWMWKHDLHKKTIEGEIWKKIEGYPNYSVSNMGRVRIDRNNYIKKLNKNFGYNLVALSNNSNNKTHRMCRLVAQAFIPNPKNLPIVDHINTIKDDDRTENLRWVTHSGNNNNPLTRKKKIKSVAKCKLYTKKPIEIYDSVTNASKKSGVSMGKISEVANNNKRNSKKPGARYNAGGYTWVFLDDLPESS
jgi:hypothetical protein